VLKTRKGQQIVRSFSDIAKVKCRGYSRWLQRAIVDFGADQPFEKVAEKLKEHYGITLAQSAARNITERHAEIMHGLEELELKKGISNSGKSLVIAETDGSLVPIVETTMQKNENENIDLRKHKTLGYREAKLCLAHAKGSITPVFAATMGDVREAGKRLLHCVKQVGMNKKTKIHGVGDGAPWIAEQFEEQFGLQGKYLVDFYHFCEYLSAAANAIFIDKKERQEWLDTQKINMKQGFAQQVLRELVRHLEPQDTAEENAPIRKCHRYINNRPGQFDYKQAIEDDLPIGSGEIESGHRYIIQKRLKLPGAWWEIGNADNMLSLRTLRANKKWQNYWDGYSSRLAS